MPQSQVNVELTVKSNDPHMCNVCFIHTFPFQVPVIRD